jgi:hypothetical protein
VGEHDELSADAKQADDFGAELVQPVGRDEIEQLLRENEVERPRGVIELERLRLRNRPSRQPRRDRLREFDLVDVHARPAPGEKNDALPAEGAEDEDLRLPVAECARDRPPEPAARLARGGHGGRFCRTRT